MSLSSALNLAGMALRPAAAGALHWGAAAATSAMRTVQQRGLLWSVEREKGHVYKNPDDIINDKEINAALDKTKKAAKDPSAIKQILQAAKDRSFLTNFTPGALRPVGHHMPQRTGAPRSLSHTSLIAPSSPVSSQVFHIHFTINLVDS